MTSDSWLSLACRSTEVPPRATIWGMNKNMLNHAIQGPKNKLLCSWDASQADACAASKSHDANHLQLRSHGSKRRTDDWCWWRLLMCWDQKKLLRHMVLKRLRCWRQTSSKADMIFVLLCLRLGLSPAKSLIRCKLRNLRGSAQMKPPSWGSQRPSAEDSWL